MSRTQLRKPFCLFRFGHVHVLVEEPDTVLSLHFAFSITDGKYPYWFGTFKLDVCAGGGSFEEVAAVAFFFAFVVVVVFVADVFFFAD